MPSFLVFDGEAKETMSKWNADCVDAIVCDPPYGFSFMGKKWDSEVPSVELWKEALRVLKPGGHLLAFGGPRTYHRLAVAIEDAGFEIRDQVMWVFGSGFPKSQNVSKAIDKAAGAQRKVIGPNPNARPNRPNSDSVAMHKGSVGSDLTEPATDAARQLEGWGTALKPAHEPIVLARKPLVGTVAENVLQFGTGAMNINGCRVPTDDGGRWPANFIHDGSGEVIELFPTTGPTKNTEVGGPDDKGGSAARFFYCAKASKADREDGLPVDEKGRKNLHPTVKPTTLMRYLCSLVTPPGGLILDPFCGSGSTGRGAVLEGFNFVGIELDPEYATVARARIEATLTETDDDDGTTAASSGGSGECGDLPDEYSVRAV